MGRELIYLSREDTESIALSMKEIVKNIVEEVFEEKGLGRVEMPPKPSIHLYIPFPVPS